jgi:membrane protein implicated in regulation of membrane protease activity
MERHERRNYDFIVIPFEENLIVRVVAILAFVGGLVLAVRVMFFGVRRVDGEQLHHRRWPLALAAFLAAAGIALYARLSVGQVTLGWVAAVVFLGLVAGWLAWWLVRRSASSSSTDPEDDPRYRFQGHVARIVQPIKGGVGRDGSGRIAFTFDGRPFEFSARWVDGADFQGQGGLDSEVVIERIDDAVAFVEPWAVVERRL